MRFCSTVIDEKPLRFRGEVYHPYHFNCTSCGIELNSDAREVKGRPGYSVNEMVKIFFHFFYFSFNLFFHYLNKFKKIPTTKIMFFIYFFLFF